MAETCWCWPRKLAQSTLSVLVHSMLSKDNRFNNIFSKRGTLHHKFCYYVNINNIKVCI